MRATKSIFRTNNLLYSESIKSKGESYKNACKDRADSHLRRVSNISYESAPNKITLVNLCIGNWALNNRETLKREFKDKNGMLVQFKPFMPSKCCCRNT